jgi:hypothetical protein
MKRTSAPTLNLNPDTSEVLRELRASAETTEVFGFESGTCERIFRELTEPLLVNSGLNLLRLNQYRWYVQELAVLFRRKAGLDLAYCLEGTMRKWVGQGLESNTVQLLLCQIVERLQKMSEPSTPHAGKAG